MNDVSALLYPEEVRSLQEATALNNRGVGHLAEGESRRALACFQETLTIVRDNTASLLPSSFKVTGENQRNPLVDPVSASTQVPGFSPSNQAVCNQAFLLDSAAFFSPVTGRPCCQLVIFLEHITAFVIFNMSLAYQQWSLLLSRQEEAHNKMQKASRLYALCFQQIKSWQAQTTSGSSLQRAAAINLAYIFQTLRVKTFASSKS